MPKALSQGSSSVVSVLGLAFSPYSEVRHLADAIGWTSANIIVQVLSQERALYLSPYYASFNS